MICIDIATCVKIDDCRGKTMAQYFNNIYEKSRVSTPIGHYTAQHTENPGSSTITNLKWFPATKGWFDWFQMRFSLKTCQNIWWITIIRSWSCCCPFPASQRINFVLIYQVANSHFELSFSGKCQEYNKHTHIQTNTERQADRDRLWDSQRKSEVRKIGATYQHPSAQAWGESRGGQGVDRHPWSWQGV